MQAQQKRYPMGKKAASLSPLQHSQKHGQALSKGRGSRKQQEVLGSWVNLEGTSRICIMELIQDFDAQILTAVATGTQAGNVKQKLWTPASLCPMPW